MKRFMLHVVVPGLATLAVVALYLTPVTIIPCVTRGLIALGVVFGALLAGFATSGLAFIARSRKDPLAFWWIVSTAILVIPGILVLGPLG